MTSVDKICGMDLNDFIVHMEEFHGYRSPGILLGGFMIEAALDRLGPTHYINIVSETVVCLPDAVQLLTPCTIGNGFLQLLDWGKFAITAYDRMTLAGVRAGLNHDRLISFPMIRQWFDRTEPRGEKPAFEDLAAEILTAKGKLIVCREVKLYKALKESTSVRTQNCPECGDSYPARLGEECPGCSGQAYYR